MNKHEWSLGDGVGAAECAHEPLDETAREKEGLEAGSPAHEALTDIVMNTRLLNNAKHCELQVNGAGACFRHFRRL